MGITTQEKAIEKIKRSRRRWWWTSEVARILGKSRQQVYNDIQSGQLKAERTGPRKMRIWKRDLMNYLGNWDAMQ